MWRFLIVNNFRLLPRLRFRRVGLAVEEVLGLPKLASGPRGRRSFVTAEDESSAAFAAAAAAARPPLLRLKERISSSSYSSSSSSSTSASSSSFSDSSSSSSSLSRATNSSSSSSLLKVLSWLSSRMISSCSFSSSSTFAFDDLLFRGFRAAVAVDGEFDRRRRALLVAVAVEAEAAEVDG